MIKLFIVIFSLILLSIPKAEASHFGLFGNFVKKYITQNSSGQRSWSDGKAAVSCNSYLNPNSNTYKYFGQTGNGIYLIQPAGVAFPVYCNMVDNGGGWTLVLKQAANDGSTLAGSNGYWTNINQGTLSDVASNLNENDGNLVSQSFTKMPISQLMLKAANESTFQNQAVSTSSAFAAFQSIATFDDDCNSTRPNWYIRSNTYPDGEALTSARFGFNFLESSSTYPDFCGARWGWAENQDACGAAPGSDDACGGLGGMGSQYGSLYMNSTVNSLQPATLYLYAR
jgi:hypothetical protein